MALFAMLFGTRRAAATEHNRGLVLAMAFESLFKLGAMLVLGAMLLWPAHALPHALPARVPLPHDTQGFPALILLGALAMFALPHQFHAGVVECRDARHVQHRALAVPAVPAADRGADPAAGPTWAMPCCGRPACPRTCTCWRCRWPATRTAWPCWRFLGGLSAATSMVVVATLALSLMVANHFIAPLRVRAGWGRGEQGDLRGQVLTQRRLAILVIVLLSWAYSRVLAGNDALADIGAHLVFRAGRTGAGDAGGASTARSWAHGR